MLPVVMKQRLSSDLCCEVESNPSTELNTSLLRTVKMAVLENSTHNHPVTRRQD